MRGQLRAYNYINAKLRARIGNMLDDEFFRSIAGSASVDEAVSELESRGFDDVAAAYRDTGDVRMCEQELYHREVRTLLDVERHFEGARREFVEALCDRYEVENLKTALRLWFERAVRGKHVETKIGYLSREPVHRPIDYDAIANAASPGDIPRALAGTPYAETIAATIDRVQSSGSLFAVERSLDRDYLARLFGFAEQLPRPDREAARSFAALEADRENVSWIARASAYYNLSEPDIRAGIVPGGGAFDTRTLDRALQSGRPTAVVLERLGGGGGRAEGREVRELELIEAALEEEADRLVHRSLGAFPFTMAVVLSYFVLSQRQLRRISAVLNGLFYGLEREALEAAL
ncbi:MAG: V0D/AC39 family V-type ATPase subunit [Spirochaetaceae bacterium]